VEAAKWRLLHIRLWLEFVRLETRTSCWKAAPKLRTSANTDRELDIGVQHLIARCLKWWPFKWRQMGQERPMGVDGVLIVCRERGGWTLVG